MNRRFLTGCIGGLLLFVAANLLAAHLLSDCGLPAVLQLAHCSDDIVRAGFPIPFYEDGGFAYRHVFNPVLVVLDVVIGVAVSLLAGWVYTRRK